MHVTIFHVGKNKKHFCNSVQLPVRKAETMLTALQSQGHAQYTLNASAEHVQYVEPQEYRTFLWPLSL